MNQSIPFSHPTAADWDWSSILGGVKIIPVLVIERVEDAVPLATALVEGGLPLLEITLRTAAAIDAIRAITTCVPSAKLAVGTLIDPSQFSQCADLNLRFGVSPGATPELIRASAEQAPTMPWLPAIQTLSEAMCLRQVGFRLVKFFPAMQAGGVAHVKAMASVLPDLRFCPTGGINASNAAEYLAQPNVACIGGSWMAPPDLIKAQDWPTIRSLAREATKLTT